MVFALYLELSRPRRTLGGRGVVVVDHTMVFRWVQRYAAELDGRCRPYLRVTKDSYRVDETYIKVKKQWCDLYRAVDSEGNTIDFMLSTTQDTKAAERFFRRAFRTSHPVPSRLITVDEHAAYPLAFEALQQEGTLPGTSLLRQCKYLNNEIEQDHRFVKRRVNLGLGLRRFPRWSGPSRAMKPTHAPERPA